MGPKVDQCCCGCPLKTGTIFIAFYHIVISSVVLVVAPILLYNKYTSTEKPRNSTEVNKKQGKEEDKKQKHHEFLDDGIKGVYILVISVFALNMIINILLIIGAKKEKPLFINVWIVVNSVFLMTAIVVFVMNLFMAFLDDEPPLKSIGASALCIVTTSYFIIVVNSFHHKLDHRQVAPRAPPIVFVIDPPPEPDPPPPPYTEDFELLPPPFHAAVELHPPPS